MFPNTEIYTEKFENSKDQRFGKKKIRVSARGKNCSPQYSAQDLYNCTRKWHMRIQKGKREIRIIDFFENQRFRGNIDTMEIARIGGERGDGKAFEGKYQGLEERKWIRVRFRKVIDFASLPKILRVTDNVTRKQQKRAFYRCGFYKLVLVNFLFVTQSLIFLKITKSPSVSFLFSSKEKLTVARVAANL